MQEIKTKDGQASVITKKKEGAQYSHGEVFAQTLDYFNGDDLAASTWINKYCLKDNSGNLYELDPSDMHKRMAKEFARIEKKFTKRRAEINGNMSNYSKYYQRRDDLTYEKIFNYFDHFSYIIPQGSVMSMLGNTFQIGSLSNCIVVPSPKDSYGGICRTDEQLAQLMKRRCGVGTDISTLRPQGTVVNNAARTSTGAVSFMGRYSHTTREVAQGGRRGALMLTMDIRHPDVKKFISIKQDLSKITGANISLRLRDEFMEAVKNKEKYTHKWPVDDAEPTITDESDAVELWDEIIRCAHKAAEPGIIFWDRQHWYSTSSVYPQYKNLSTNPCSEIAMQGGDSCRLIVIPYFSFVKNPFTKEATFDYDKLYEVSYEAQRLMDDLVELELEHIDRIIKKIKDDPEEEDIKNVELKLWNLLKEQGGKARRTGLGFTALGDALAALGVRFDSKKALEIIEEIMKAKCRGEWDSSIDMALERGTFDGFDPNVEKTSEFIQMLKTELPEIYKRNMKYGRRNVSISTVAPTGTVSMMAQTTSGIEPVYMLKYVRNRKVNPNDKLTRVDYVDDLGDAWMKFEVMHPKLKMWTDITGKEDINKSPYAKCEAHNIKWKKRVEIQGVVQKYITHSISSTINLPKDATVDDVSAIYMHAWKNGLKGITVYRDGSRTGVLVSQDESIEETFSDTKAPKRTKKLECDVIRFQNNYEKWIAFIGLRNGRPYEIFTGRADEFPIPGSVTKGWTVKARNGGGKSRYDFHYIDMHEYKQVVKGLSRAFNKEYWNYAKLISMNLRHGAPLKYVIGVIEDLQLNDDTINTWKNGLLRAIKKYVADGEVPKDRLCENCGDIDGYIYEEGCLKCKSCGYQKCS